MSAAKLHCPKSEGRQMPARKNIDLEKVVGVTFHDLSLLWIRDFIFAISPLG
jgi:hypothetical protein